MGFKFKPDICNGCRDVLLMSMKLNYIAILNIHSVDYDCIISEISKTPDGKLLTSLSYTTPCVSNGV